jgi:hypothetical protein
MESFTKLGKTIGLTTGVFAVVGVALGLTGFFPIEYITSQLTNAGEGEFTQAIGQLFVGLIFFQSVMMAMFVGPTIAGLTGIASGISLEDHISSFIVGSVGSFVGFYIMVLTAVIVMSLAVPSTGSGAQSGIQQSADLSQLISPIIKSGVPTGIVGGITGVFGGMYRN